MVILRETDFAKNVAWEHRDSFIPTAAKAVLHPEGTKAFNTNFCQFVQANTFLPGFGADHIPALLGERPGRIGRIIILSRPIKGAITYVFIA
jgi:hypothetical protein